MQEHASIYSGAFAPLSLQQADGLDSIAGVARFEALAKKGMSLVEGYQKWAEPNPAFPTAWMDQVRAHGSIPYMGWESRVGGAAGGDGTPKGNPNQPDFALKQIYAEHKYDAYIHQWAKDAAAWGHPFFLRFDAEMNANRQPFSVLMNGNQPHDFIEAWTYVRDIFAQEKATNVTWVWCVSVYYAEHGFVPLADLALLYPGHDQVDWIGINGYNYGQNNNVHITSPWQTFSQVFTPTYEAIQTLAPDKPIIVETGCAEQGGSKAEWIKDAYQVQIPAHFPHVKGIVWFNYNNAYLADDNCIDSSAAVTAAFQAALASPLYAANDYAALAATPIPAL